MFKRILLPVDPAKPFGAANEYAVELAKRFGARVVMTYIIDDHLLGPVAEEAATSIDEALEWVGRGAMEDFEEAHPDVECQKTLAYGSTPTALFQMVLQTGADLVVLGGYHSRASPHVWGSTVVDVVRHAERPVFVVRELNHLPTPTEPIVVPFDGSERPVQNLPRIVQFAKEMGTKIHLINVAKSKYREKAQAALDKGRWIVEQEDVAVETHLIQRGILQSKGRAILNYAKKVDSHLIAISRLGRTSTHTGHSHTVAWLLAHSPVPVWVVRK